MKNLTQEIPIVETVPTDPSSLPERLRAEAQRILTVLESGNCVLTDVIRRIFGKRLWTLLITLQRIDEGKYGLCVECDAPIETDRLEQNNPVTALCLGCRIDEEHTDRSAWVALAKKNGIAARRKFYSQMTAGRP